mmetsp:Transcript_16856/g.42196  ORF Transcript_16856/g.42196 Transcript_16856/m.42196 type:complete len:243 (-) Transcript_16856:812-1540(-)
MSVSVCVHTWYLTLSHHDHLDILAAKCDLHFQARHVTQRLADLLRVAGRQRDVHVARAHRAVGQHVGALPCGAQHRHAPGGHLLVAVYGVHHQHGGLLEGVKLHGLQRVQHAHDAHRPAALRLRAARHHLPLARARQLAQAGLQHAQHLGQRRARRASHHLLRQLRHAGVLRVEVQAGRQRLRGGHQRRHQRARLLGHRALGALDARQRLHRALPDSHAARIHGAHVGQPLECSQQLVVGRG